MLPPSQESFCSHTLLTSLPSLCCCRFFFSLIVALIADVLTASTASYGLEGKCKKLGCRRPVFPSALVLPQWLRPLVDSFWIWRSVIRTKAKNTFWFTHQCFLPYAAKQSAGNTHLYVDVHRRSASPLRTEQCVPYHMHAILWCLWTLLCCCSSFPSILYSVVCANCSGNSSSFFFTPWM